MACIVCICFSPSLQLVFQAEDSSFSDLDDLANTFSKVIFPPKLEFHCSNFQRKLIFFISVVFLRKSLYSYYILYMFLIRVDVLIVTLKLS
jgi:hypothetical protein